jgi:hypothetical protein
MANAMPTKGRTRVWLKAQNINLALDLIALRLNQAIHDYEQRCTQFDQVWLWLSHKRLTPF